MWGNVCVTGTVVSKSMSVAESFEDVGSKMKVTSKKKKPPSYARRLARREASRSAAEHAARSAIVDAEQAVEVPVDAEQAVEVPAEQAGREGVPAVQAGRDEVPAEQAGLEGVPVSFEVAVEMLRKCAREESDKEAPTVEDELTEIDAEAKVVDCYNSK